MITNGLKNTQQNLAFLNSQIGIVKHSQNITLKLGTKFKKEPLSQTCDTQHLVEALLFICIDIYLYLKF